MGLSNIPRMPGRASQGATGQSRHARRLASEVDSHEFAGDNGIACSSEPVPRLHDHIRHARCTGSCCIASAWLIDARQHANRTRTVYMTVRTMSNASL